MEIRSGRSQVPEVESWPAFDPSRPIAIIGAGVMGSKVAWACARSGLPTRLFDVVTENAAAARDALLSWGNADERENVAAALSIHGDLGQAVGGASLVFENVPEDPILKVRVLEEIGRLSDPNAYMGSNTSSLLCTPLAQASGRPDRFFNMNFTDPRTSRLVELMGCTETALQTQTFAKAWAAAIGMVAVELKKEQVGYSHNRLWRVIKKEVLRQIDEGISTPEDIDRAWMLSYDDEIGPCGAMDEVGLGTVLAIEKIYHSQSGDDSDRPSRTLLAMVDQGYLGVVTGRGFYSYPDPSFRHADFLAVGKAL